MPTENVELTTIKEFFSKNDTFAKHCGIELTSVTRGGSIAQMVIDDSHFNAAGTVHGGAIFTLADFALAVASNSHGTLALATNVTISFIKATLGGTLVATVREIAEPKRLGTYEVTITNERAETIAIFIGTVYRKNEPILVK